MKGIHQWPKSKSGSSVQQGDSPGLVPTYSFTTVVSLSTPQVQSAEGELSAPATAPAIRAAFAAFSNNTASSMGTTASAVTHQHVTMAGSFAVNVPQEEHKHHLQKQQPDHQQPEHHHQTHRQQHLVPNPDQSSDMSDA